MKKLIFAIIILLFGFSAMAQKPERIVSFVIEPHECDWYQTQAGLWKKEVMKSKKNATAWMYYYLASRYEHVMCADPRYNMQEADYKALNDIMEDMGKHIPNSYEYNYLMYYNTGWGNPDNAKYLLKAYEIDSNRSEIYPDLIVYFEVNGKYAEKNRAVRHRQEISPASPGMLAWNYNALATLDENAIVLCGGDNDTYQKWTLQVVNNIRPDVRVINTSLIMIESYRNRLFTELGIAPFTTKVDSSNWQNFNELIVEHICHNRGTHPVYICNSVPENHYSSLKDSLYLEGTVYKYSPERYDNVAVIRKNYEQVMLLDYIIAPLSADVSQSIVDNSNLNYIPAFLQLYDHYKLCGETDKAGKLAGLLRLLVSRAHSEEYRQYVEDYMTKN
ncbi:hypothetical protein SDC9_55061 [bioreactor metagenome]|uniref:Uncharacterized protein n=1 Tax=bioreactor metagenome TaxID=1076179 RepID=A0A644WYG3_9ZZZZ